jgi:HK97 family phage major capsid protein
MSEITTLEDFMAHKRTQRRRELKAFPTYAQAERAAAAFTKAQSTGINTAGGVLVNSEEVSDAVINLRDAMGVARRTCTVIQSPSDVITIPRRLTGLSINYIAENNTVTESSMSWDAVKHTAKKDGTYVRLSRDWAEDAVGAMDWIANETGYQFAANEDNVLFNGDGTSTYFGMTGLLTKLSSSSGLAGSVSAASARTTLTSFDVNDLNSVCSVLPNTLRNPAWFCSRPVYYGIFCRLANQGFIPANANGLPLWWNMPIYITNQMPTAMSSLNQKIVLLVSCTTIE